MYTLCHPSYLPCLLPISIPSPEASGGYKNTLSEFAGGRLPRAADRETGSVRPSDLLKVQQIGSAHTKILTFSCKLPFTLIQKTGTTMAPGYSGRERSQRCLHFLLIPGPCESIT